ncbi:MAG: LuxR C-terminal-related transcriptional regulator [Granulosicoccus sp.]
MENEKALFLVDEYLNGPYLLDPFFEAATSGKASGFSSMTDLAPDHFYQSEFYRYHYERTGIADEIGIFFPVQRDRTAVISVTRQKPNGVFSAEEKHIFSSTAPIISTLCKLHWGDTLKQDHAVAISRTITQVFDGFGQETLTQREKEIIALVLKGHSSLSIGLNLDITAGTVKIHRKNAYRKLNLSSQAELFALFLRSLEDRLRASELQ